MTRQIELHEVLNNAMDYHLTNMYTAIPGTVITVRDGLNQQSVDVQPVISLRNEEGDDYTERPPIVNVPLQMPITSLGGLSIPIQKGDSVMLIFSMRGLDVWKRGGGGSAPPSDMRMFDIRDCVAIPGTYPFSQSPNNPQGRSNGHDTSDVVLVHNIGSGNEVEIRLKTNGDVVVNSPQKVIVNCQDAEVNSDKFTVNSDEVEFNCGSYEINAATYAMSASDWATSTGTITHNGSYVLNGTPIETHDHSGVQTGGSRTNSFGS